MIEVMTGQSVDRKDLLASLPDDWPVDLLPAIRRQVRSSGRKLVVLDDDPTGTQTVHDVPVLTRWSAGSLRDELEGSSPLLFLLTNSRSLSPRRAAELSAQIGRDLVEAARQAGTDFAVISRSDSTLRGHFPAEVASLAKAVDQSVDACLLIPFFLEGGRYTIGDTHYVAEGQRLIPVGETEYARDTAFGYRESNLRRWVAERTNGRVPIEAVATISIEDIRCGGPERVADRLSALSDGAVCIVNAASMRDLEVFVHGLLMAEERGRRFLYRTAASFVQVRAGIRPRPLLTRSDFHLSPSGGGLFIVGSHVIRTTRQLDALLAETETRGIAIDVVALLDDARREGEISRVAKRADQAVERGEDVTIYTTRRLVAGESARDSLSIGQGISNGVVSIVQTMSSRPGYVVAKGGITSSDVANHGMGVQRAMVLGQILPGVPVWRLGPRCRYPGLVYVVFPGNVGDFRALVRIAETMKSRLESASKYKGE